MPESVDTSRLYELALKDGVAIKLRSIETKLSNLRADLNANNNTDLIFNSILHLLKVEGFPYNPNSSIFYSKSKQ